VIDVGLGAARVAVFGAGTILQRAGLGPAAALRLAETGARVACVDLSPDRAAETVKRIQAAGGEAEAFTADVTDEDQVSAVITAISDRLGGLDVCVDIIGHSNWSNLIATSRPVWETALAENLSQVFFIFKAAAARMIDQGTGGSLVALSSVDGMQGAPMHAAYGAAKGGLIALVQSMADEWGRYGIRVNTVAPGNVGGRDLDTGPQGFGQNPANPLAPPRPADVANAVLFLASNLGERITGQSIVVDGGALIKNRWGIGDASPAGESRDSFLAAR
jgi:NAD(P)-dependent dehydrogenase (short-subunit alcohol dehydrogenase family)